MVVVVVVVVVLWHGDDVTRGTQLDECIVMSCWAEPIVSQLEVVCVCLSLQLVQAQLGRHQKS